MSDIVNRRDLQFLLYELLNLDQLAAHPLYENYDRDSVDGILDAAEAIAEEKFLPTAAKMDANGARFSDGKAICIPETAEALEAYAEAGFFAMSFSEEVGGLQMPYTLSLAINGMFSAANQAVHGFALLTSAAANLLSTHGNEEQKAMFLGPMVEGRWFGTMCLSEPQAGSSLSDIRTKAEARADGTFNISGTKMWISGGDHELSENIVHMVLARTPDGPPGVKGISLFIVPKYRVNADGSLGEYNNITLAGLNHKMGGHGNPNTVLNFGDGDETIGYLVGEANQGLAKMFHMMNEARVAVGYNAAMSGLAGYLHSLDYARNRPQGRQPLNKDPLAKQVPIIEHSDIKRMLLAQKCWVEGSMGLILYCARLIDEKACTQNDERLEELSLLIDLLTPIAKSYPAEFCLEANKLAIQVLGGYGYTQDYPVERFYRENRLNLIHEGTHGIQGLDLLGRKIRMHGGAALKLLIGRIEDTIAVAKNSALAAEADQLNVTVRELLRTVETVSSRPDRTQVLANATLFLDAMGHVVIAWIWLQQGLAATRQMSGLATDEDFYNGKLRAARFYFRYELPKVAPLLEVVMSEDRITFDARAAEFTGV